MEKSLNYLIREQKMSVGQFAGNTHPLPLPKGGGDWIVLSGYLELFMVFRLIG